MGEPHKHAELIKLWAEGAEIELMKTDGTWSNADVPTWSEWCTYRIKPEPPKYPQTSYSETTLACICHNNGTKKPSFTDVANAAIARAIEDGQVFTADAVKAAVDAANIGMVPAAMLEKMAEAVRSELVDHRYKTRSLYFTGDVDIAAIIKRVKEGN